MRHAEKLGAEHGFDVKIMVIEYLRLKNKYPEHYV